MKRILLSLVTDASGDSVVQSGQALLGKLYAIEYRPGSIVTGATVTVTCVGDAAKPLLTKANAGTADSWYYPRDLVHGVADGAALTGTAGGDRSLPILNGYPKVVVGSGGDTKTGSLILYYED
jgi:hypothetical protein